MATPKSRTPDERTGHDQPRPGIHPMDRGTVFYSCHGLGFLGSRNSEHQTPVRYLNNALPPGRELQPLSACVEVCTSADTVCQRDLSQIHWRKGRIGSLI